MANCECHGMHVLVVMFSVNVRGLSGLMHSIFFFPGIVCVCVCFGMVVWDNAFLVCVGVFVFGTLLGTCARFVLRRTLVSSS